jgi:hypothetical protein
MKLVTFRDYDEYKEIQVRANRLKFHDVYAEDPVLRRIANHFQARVTDAVQGLCHGVRNGYEVRAFRRLLPTANIMGTDLADTVAGVPHCFVWDMHKVKPEWVGRIAFMYSNSWDHTYSPGLLFQRWSQCLSPGGRLYLAHTELHTRVTEHTKIDAFGCEIDELLSVLRNFFAIEEVLQVPPALTWQVLKRRLAYLRAGQLRKVLTARLMSRPVSVIVCQRKPSDD